MTEEPKSDGVCLSDSGKIGPTISSTSPSLNSFQTDPMLKLEGLQGPLLSGMCECTLGGNSETGYWALERAKAM